MNDTPDDLDGFVTEQRMTAAGWTPEQRKIAAQQCLLGQAQSIAAGKPGEARRLGGIIDMLSELDAVPAAAAGPGTAVVHELEFLDREARPAIWHVRCSAPDVPLEQTTSVPQNITCPACLAGPGTDGGE